VPFLTKEPSERDLIVGTIADIQAAIVDLSDTIEAMTDELEAKRSRLAAWKKKLDAIDGARSVERRPKGANLATIKTCLEGAPDGLSASDVRTKTGLPWSSVQRVLTQHPDQFVEVGGLWKLRQRTPKTSSGPQKTIAIPRRPVVIQPSLVSTNGHNDESDEPSSDPDDFSEFNEPDE